MGQQNHDLGLMEEEIGFGLFRTLVERIPWEAVLRGQGAQEDWTLLRKEVLQAEEQPIPMCHKPMQGRLAWMNSKLPLGVREQQRV